MQAIGGEARSRFGKSLVVVLLPVALSGCDPHPTSDTLQRLLRSQRANSFAASNDFGP